MKTVWKFRIDPNREFEKTFLIPEDARVVHVAHEVESSVQDYFTLWIELDSTKPTVERRFRLIGTGHAIPEGGTHVGTTIVGTGRFVWHIYEAPTEVSETTAKKPATKKAVG